MVTVSRSVASFRFFPPGARQVFLVGDVNAWCPGDLAMAREASGYWRATIRLPAGDFRFRYWADGDWYSDFAAFGLDVAPHGHNSVVRIGPGRARAAVPRPGAAQFAAS
jgi:1,4-alpha-glucan branching enzyme